LLTVFNLTTIPRAYSWCIYLYAP